jgi:hypothetical protein
MLPYWILFLVPAFAALLSDRTVRIADGPTAQPRLTLGWAASGIALALIVGYRYEVGGDWATYFRYITIASQAESASQLLALPDPGFMLLNWIAVQLGFSVVAVNVVGGAIFATGIVQFCRAQTRPWLALAVATPYLVVVVGMGYSRQGIALSLGLLGLLALQRGSLFRFFAWVVVAATFHRTAVLLLPIAALAGSRRRWWTIVWVAVVTAAAYMLFLSESVDALYTNYVEAEYQSEGALVRLLMNALPAMLLLMSPKRFRFPPLEASLWRWFAAISLVLLGVLFLTSASTAVDRIALYMIPLQIVVFSRLPAAWGGGSRSKQSNVVWIVLLYYTSVLFVWLFFAVHARLWLPYQFYPFV